MIMKYRKPVIVVSVKCAIGRNTCSRAGCQGK